MTCQLYRHFAEDGTLLYVGIGNSAVARTGQHAKKPWAPHIARIEIEDHPDRERAEKAERWAIGCELPVFNKQMQSGLPMTNAEVGKAMNYTLADAYRMAGKGDVLHTIDPVEFATMTRAERRHHRRLLNRLARASR